MTSPYLQRPKRSLDQALVDTGRAAPIESGLAAAPAHTAMRQQQAKGPARLSRSRVVLAFGIGLALLAGTTILALRTEFEQPIASDTEADGNADLLPAAGPSSGSDNQSPAADTRHWGDAPSLQPPRNGGAAGD